MLSGESPPRGVVDRVQLVVTITDTSTPTNRLTHDGLVSVSGRRFTTKLSTVSVAGSRHLPRGPAHDSPDLRASHPSFWFGTGSGQGRGDLCGQGGVGSEQREVRADARAAGAFGHAGQQERGDRLARHPLAFGE